MSVHKRKDRGGSWCYVFDLPGSTRGKRQRVRDSGFATRKEAQEAESAARVEAQQKHERARAGLATELPRTLASLLETFFNDHAVKKLEKTTVEGYRERAARLAPELLAMDFREIRPLHLNREWTRLLECGGVHRWTKAPRPLSEMTVSHVAGMLSSAYNRAIKWELTTFNPVKASEPPIPKQAQGGALLSSEQDLLIAAASGWMATLLAVAAAAAVRRGEALALRWQDLVDGRLTVARSLAQTREGLHFKTTKNKKSRPVALPSSTLTILEAHRQKQNKFRRQFGPDYRADLDLIFANPDGTPLKPDSVSALVSALFKKLKIAKPKGASLHLLRHSHASHLLEEGVSLPTVSKRLGHDNVYITAKVYSHALRGSDDEAAKTWEEAQQRNRVLGGHLGDTSGIQGGKVN